MLGLLYNLLLTIEVIKFQSSLLEVGNYRLLQPNILAEEDISVFGALQLRNIKT